MSKTRRITYLPENDAVFPRPGGAHSSSSSSSSSRTRTGFGRLLVPWLQHGDMPPRLWRAIPIRRRMDEKKICGCSYHHRPSSFTRSPKEHTILVPGVPTSSRERLVRGRETNKTDELLGERMGKEERGRERKKRREKGGRGTASGIGLIHRYHLGGGGGCPPHGPPPHGHTENNVPSGR
ncbi:hypothetical protein LZ30DRAFT_179592 [Colletotrichum cereale]|nr:hypothetical protein LZ30DRAFT_179592 [Colletotrichum cereale]